MKLKDISIYISKEATDRPVFQVNFAGIDMLYSSLLSKDYDYIAANINIFFTNDATEFDRIETFRSTMSYYVFFDFYEFYQIPEDYLKRKFVLDKIQEAMLNICKKTNYDYEYFENIYQKCVQKNIQCRWFFDNKLFRSPNRDFYFGLESTINFSDYKIYEVLFDSQKNEVSRRLCFQDSASTFKIKWASWKENNDMFYYSFGGNRSKFKTGPKKIFECKILDLLENKSYQLPNKVSEYFKR